MIRVEASCIVIGAAPWVKVPDYSAVTGELYEAIVESFRARRIVIPVPQRDVRVLSGAAYLAQRPEERLAGRDAA